MTLRSAALREALQAERAQLEARVVERTAELAEVNARLHVELKSVSTARSSAPPHGNRW